LRNDDVSREGRDVEDRAAVAVDAAEGAAPALVADVSLRRDREVRPDGAAEGIRFELESGSPRHRDADVARMRGQLVPPVLGQSAAELDVAADRMGLDPLRLEVLEDDAAADAADLDP